MHTLFMANETNAIETKWTIVTNEIMLMAALGEARGSYQCSIVRGNEALSGSTLRGTAKKWGGKYQQSAYALLGRLTKAGIPWHEARGPHGRRVLVIGR